MLRQSVWQLIITVILLTGLMIGCFGGHPFDYTDLISSSITTSEESSTSDTSTIPETFLSLVSAEALSPTEVKLTFSGSLNGMADALYEVGNYDIPSLGVLFVVWGTDEPDAVYLITESQAAQAYTITVSGITSQKGEALGEEDTTTFNGFNYEGECPYLTAIEAINRSTVLVTFSAPMEPESVQNPDNYYIEEIAVYEAIQTYTLSQVYLYTSYLSEASYNLIVQNMKDANGTTVCENNSMRFMGSEVRDEIQPTLVSAESINSTTVHVLFSEPMDQGTVEDPNNYSIPGLAVNSIVVINDQYTQVSLNTSPQEFTDYTLTITNVTDTSSNDIGDPNTATFQGTETPDTDPPNVVSVVSISTTELEVTFDEPVDQNTALNTANYALTGDVSIVSVTVDIPDNPSRVILNTTDQDVRNYTLTLNNITDQAGNSIPPDLEFEFFGDRPPSIISVTVVNLTSLQVLFSEPVGDSAMDNRNYEIDGFPPDTETITAAEISPSDSRLVNLTCIELEQQVYMLNVVNVSDTNRNFIRQEIQKPFAADGRPFVTDVHYDKWSSIYVRFSEEVDETQALNKNNYAVPGFTVTNAVWADSNRDRVRVVINTYPYGTQSITFTNVITDTNGNLLGEPYSMDFEGREADFPVLVGYELVDKHHTRFIFDRTIYYGDAVWGRFGARIDDTSGASALVRTMMVDRDCGVDCGDDPTHWNKSKAMLVAHEELTVGTHDFVFQGIRDYPNYNYIDPNPTVPFPVTVTAGLPEDTTNPKYVWHSNLRYHDTLDKFYVYVTFDDALKDPAWDKDNYSIIIDGTKYPVDSVHKRNWTTNEQNYGYYLFYLPAGVTPTSGYDNKFQVNCAVTDFADNPVENCTDGVDSSYVVNMYGYYQYIRNNGITVLSNTQVKVRFQLYPYFSTAARQLVEDASNYQISGGVTVLNAVQAPSDSYGVVLTTTPLSDQTYTLTVSNVMGRESGPIEAPHNTKDFDGNSAPMIQSIEALTTNSVRVVFTEDVDPVSAENGTFYTFDNGLAVLSADMEGTDTVVLSTTAQQDIQYTLTISNIEDLTGVPMQAPDNTGTFQGIPAQ